MKSSTVMCPICGEKSMVINTKEEEIPYFGKILIMAMNCEKCGYRATDVNCVERKGHMRYKFEVEDENDMSVKVIRSSKGKLKIPELGVEVTPGPISMGFVTNVEGLFDKIRKSIETASSWGDDKQKKAGEELIGKIDSIIAGKMKATIIIDDKTGNSAIVSERAKKQKKKD